MNIGIYGILIAFALFIIILIVNPNLSCFGKRLKSPFYPLLRRKRAGTQKKAEDYGFHLTEEGEEKTTVSGIKKGKKVKTKDYGFHQD
ncbi:MAG: hypothetical protein WCC06_04450 [Candidatus Aminicenantales bacterium]